MGFSLKNIVRGAASLATSPVRGISAAINKDRFKLVDTKPKATKSVFDGLFRFPSLLGVNALRAGAKLNVPGADKVNSVVQQVRESPKAPAVIPGVMPGGGSMPAQVAGKSYASLLVYVGIGVVLVVGLVLFLIRR